MTQSIASRPSLRPASVALALEPRILFDGAAAAAVADHHDVADASARQAQDQIAHDTAADVGKPAVEATPAHPAEGSGGTLLVIDARVADYQSLLANLPANVTVLVVQANQSGLAAIGDELAKSGVFSSIQIVSHGTPGHFALGSDDIDSTTLAAEAAQLAAWGAHLTATADILLFGCDIGQGQAGQALLTQLASLTGADIAASTNPTGAPSQGGDWTLEVHTGAIEAALALSATDMQAYDHLLAATAINDANAATPRTTAEDTPLAIGGLTITDADNPASMTLHVQTTGGTSSVTLGGATVTGGSLGSADFTLSGSMAQINAALASLQYTPETNKNSATSGFAPQIVLTATDVTNGGSGILSITNIAVTAVNDAPDLSTGVALTVSEGGSQAFALAQLATDANALDVDILTGQQVIGQQMVTITSLPTLGTLSYNGGAVVVGSVIPVTSLGNLTYTHNGADIASNTTDSFNVTVSDGGGAATDGTLSITITPKNVAPTVSGSPTLIEGQVKVVAPTINLGDSYDTLANATIVIDNIVTGGQGTLFIDANNNNVVDAGEALTGAVTLDATQRVNLATQLKFFQNGAEPNAPGAIAPSYQIHVTDAGGGEGSALTANQTITLTVLPNNDDPTLTNTHATTSTALSVAERMGQSPVVLTNAMLQIQDADRNPTDINQTTPANQLVYTIGTRPTQGEIQLYIGGGAGYDGDGWITLGDGGRFTQADIDAGHVRYYQTTNVTADTQDSFTFTVRDSAFGYDVWTDPANPAGGREGGLRNTPTGPIATQTFYINVTADATATHDAYEGPPRPATPGYGGGNMTYTFAPGTMTNGNDTATWNEANVGAGGGYVINSGMLSYTITRTDNMGTPDNPADDISITVPPAETVYTLTAQPPNGTVERKVGASWTAIPTNGQFTQQDINDGNIRFVHDGSENHTASFGYTVSDGTPNHYTSSFSLNITPTNDRPTASGGTAQVTEGNTNAVRLDGSVIGMNDVDLSQDLAKRTGEGAQDFLWFQITSQALDGGGAAHGSLQRWNGSAWVNVSPSEWLPSTLLTASADGGSSGLRYVHDGSEPLAYSGGPNLHFSYIVRDDLANPNDPFATNATTPTDTSGSAQSNQSAAASATIQIIPVNNAPLVADKPSDADPSIAATIPGGGALTGKNEILANVPEGGTATITSAFLTAIDSDNTTVQRQYRITQAPTQGVLQLNGAALGVGSTFTQADIDAGKVTYKHNGAEIGTPTTDGLGTYNDKFLFVVNDGVAEDSGNAFLITLSPTNDKPTLTAPSGPIDIDSTTATNNPIKDGANHVFTIADPDLTDGLIAGETDFVQATVRVLDASGNPISDYTTGFGGGGVSIGYATPGDISGLWHASGGANSILQIQGTRAQVNTALAGLSVTFANDTNTRYKLEVIVDDRLRDSSGNLIGGANGGTLNQAATPGGAPTAVPGAEYNWTSAASPAATDPNLTAATVDLRASRVNETPIFTGPGSLTINEDTRTPINGFVVSDPESAAFDTPVTVTVSVGSGTLDFGAAGAQTSITPSGGQAVTISGDNTGSVTLSGRAADIQALLNGRNFADSANDPNGGLFYTGALNVNHDTNGAAAGDVTLTLTFDDAGSRIGSDAGAGSVAANPPNIVSDITLTAINDAPTVNRTATTVTIPDATTIAVSGFSIGDVDSNDGYATGENDGTIQATVRVLDSSGNPLTATDYTNMGIVLNSSTPGSVTVDGVLSGNNKALELRGTLSQINTYLAGLQVQFTNLGNANLDGTYSIEVIADDRLRDAGGHTHRKSQRWRQQPAGRPARRAEHRQLQRLRHQGRDLRRL